MICGKSLEKGLALNKCSVNISSCYYITALMCLCSSLFSLGDSLNASAWTTRLWSVPFPPLYLLPHFPLFSVLQLTDLSVPPTAVPFPATGPLHLIVSLAGNAVPSCSFTWLASECLHESHKIILLSGGPTGMG